MALRLPVSTGTGYKPVVGAANPNLHPHPFASGHHAVNFGPVKDALLNVATLGEYQNPGTGRQYLNEQKQMFDPRTPEGIFNLGMALYGGKGGGKLPARYTAPADLQTTLEKAGVQPSSWVVDPDPAMEALRSRMGGKLGGVARDPDSAANFPARAVTHSGRVDPWIAKAIGPRRVGGVYESSYWGEKYRVLEIKVAHDGTDWRIKVEPVDRSGPPRWHSTSWESGKDKVVQQTPGAGPGAEDYLSHLLQMRYDPKINKPGG